MQIPRRHGTQVIERTARVLRELAARGNFGWRLADIAITCDLDRGTTHRILACLVRERLAAQRGSDRRYIPGPLMFELGLALPAMSAFQAVCDAPLARVARRLGGIALLHLRSGNDFVCAGRAGTTVIKALTIDVGTRRPLIVSAGGLAILAALPKDEARAVVADNLQRVARFGADRVRSLRRVIRQSQSLGYGVSQGEIVPGISAFGVVVRDGEGSPFASISIVGNSASLPHARASEIIAALEREAGIASRDARRVLGGGNAESWRHEDP